MALLRHLKIVRKPTYKLVLCWFEYCSKVSGLYKSYTSSLMIQVKCSADIEAEFDRAVREKLDGWYDRTWTPKPMSWTLSAYLPEDGKPVF